VLDISARHGLLGITLGTHNPNAEVVALNWPIILEAAKAKAQAASVSGRQALTRVQRHSYHGRNQRIVFRPYPLATLDDLASRKAPLR